jgi:two-component system LytT family response regulator
MKVLIIDDEIDAREYLEKIIQEFVPILTVIANVESSLDALKVLSKQEIDVIFLDIEMPNINGFEFLELIKSSEYKIIFTTAHNEYALKAFGVYADGYLLKPIDIDDLQTLTKHLSNSQKSISEQNKIAFKTHSRIEYIKPTHIIGVKGEGNYSTIFSLNKKKITVTKGIKQIEKLLNESYFIKTHKSYILNKTYIERFIKEEECFEMTDGTKIPLSSRKKTSVLHSLDDK